MMLFRIERFALGRCLQKINLISFVDLHFSDAQEQTPGVFEKDQLLQEVEQQQVELVVRKLDLARLARLNRLDVVDHDVGRRVRSVAKQFRQIAPGRFKGDIGSSNFLEVCVWHINNRHPERIPQTREESKDPAKLLNVRHRGSSTSLGMTSS